MNTKNIINTINEFLNFLTKNIEPSITELESITSDKNRSHLQRLVYTNLVDRFDSLIDILLIEFASVNSEFQKKIISTIKDESVSKAYLFNVLLSENVKEKIEEDLENIVRNDFLRKRHADKLRTLLFDCMNFSSNEIDKPRVNADGRIHITYTQSTSAKKKIPATIIGYSDWVYIRRNTLVHNFGKLALSEKDFAYIQNKYNTTPSKNVGIKIESITSVKKFYSYLLKEIKTKLEEQSLSRRVVVTY